VSLGESFTMTVTQDSENEGTKSVRNVRDYPTTRRHNPHDLNLQEQCYENLKSRKTDSQNVIFDILRAIKAEGQSV
jgi:hypothetical protein